MHSPLLICTDVLFIKLANRQTLCLHCPQPGVKDTVRSQPVTYILSLSIIPYVLNADGARVRANTASVALNNRTRRPAWSDTLNPPPPPT